MCTHEVGLDLTFLLRSDVVPLHIDSSLMKQIHYLRWTTLDETQIHHSGLHDIMNLCLSRFQVEANENNKVRYRISRITLFQYELTILGMSR